MWKEKRQNRAYLLIGIIVLVIIAVDRVNIFSPHLVPEFVLRLRVVIYILLLLFWAYTLWTRILQKTTRELLIKIVLLMVFWLSLRFLKYYYITGLTASRYLWYLYYVPNTLIPTYSFLVAHSLNKPEDFEISIRKRILLLLPTLLMILGVLTNDLHQKMFIFNIPLTDNNAYSRGPLFYLIFVWIAFVYLLFLIIMVQKCRIPNTRNYFFLPLVPYLIAIIYSILYITHPHIIYYVARDMTSTYCLLICISFEISIKLGLIQSNTNYEELFHISSVKAFIIDKKHQLNLASKDADLIDSKLVKQALDEPVLLASGNRLSSAAIHDGYVLWEEDVSDLTRNLQELNDVSEFLANRTKILREEYKTKNNLHRLEEKNAMHEALWAQTDQETEALLGLLDKLKTVRSKDKVQAKKDLLSEMILLLTFLKRRGHIVLLSSENRNIHVSELDNYLKEMVQNLLLFDLVCGHHFKLEGFMHFEMIFHCMDILQDVLLGIYRQAESIFILVDKNDKGIFILFRIVGPDTLSLNTEKLEIDKQDDEWRLVYRLH